MIEKLRNARARRRLRLEDPIQQRFSFCPVWANYLDPPAPVQVDTSAGTLIVQTGVVRSGLREYDVAEYSFPFAVPEIVAFHPPLVEVVHYNELPAVAARVGTAFVAVIPDGRVGTSEWGDMRYDAFFLAPARDDETYDAQLMRVAGVRMGLKELWGDMISFDEYIPKFSRRVAWENGEKLLRGEWFAIKLTLNITDYELTAM